jgi:hypothetical protein
MEEERRAQSDPHASAAEARRARALARASWQGAKWRPSELPEVEIVAGTVWERIGMVTPITLSAWGMAGSSVPNYSRAEAPGLILRGAGAR